MLPLLLTACLSALPGPTPEALQLASQYDAMDVEHHWLAGYHVDWRTGDPDNGKPGKTHCSAFVASACERMKIYILRPPEHGAQNLANAQFHWLEEEGSTHGWATVGTPAEAQSFANEGHVVVAVFLNPNPKVSGHIALVRPCEKTDAALESEGPQIIQAGGTNYQSTTVKEGFKRHRGAWISAQENRIHFFQFVQ